LEQALSRRLGIDQVLWITRALPGAMDPQAMSTNSLVTRLVDATQSSTQSPWWRYTAPDTIMSPLLKSEPVACARAHPRRAAFPIVELPLPSPVIFEGQRLRPRYSNF